MRPECSIPECDKPVDGRGWCAKHRQRWKVTGDPLGLRPTGRPRRDETERFWEKVEKTDACWIWQSTTDEDGYGFFKVRQPTVRMWRAHRYSWVLHFGPIPSGLFVCHHCDTPPCVRPDHLFLGTALHNNRDSIAKGRHIYTRRH